MKKNFTIIAFKVGFMTGYVKGFAKGYYSVISLLKLKSVKKSHSITINNQFDIFDLYYKNKDDIPVSP